MKVLNKILVCALIFGSFLHATDHRKDMLAEFDFIHRSIEQGYAPAAWKHELFNWKLKKQASKIKSKIKDSSKITVKEYQQLLKKFFDSFRDDHVNIRFLSTEFAVLPFDIIKIDDRYYVSYVDSAQLNSVHYPIKVGDEVLEFDGHHLDKFVKKYALENPSPTEIAKAVEKITSRKAERGQVVPKGIATVKIRHQNNSEKKYHIAWDYSPEKLNIKKPPVKSPFPLLMAKMEAGDFSDDDEKVGMRSRKSFIPPLGTIVWEVDEDCEFYAYIYQNAEGKMIGCIRISDYVKFEDSVQKFAEIISYMEDETDALVIDQVYNPGGILFTCYAMLSHLTDRPLYAPKHRVGLTTELVFEAIQLEEFASKITNNEEAQAIFGETMVGYPVDYQFAQQVLSYARTLIEDWENGETISRPTCLFAVDYVMPHPDGYYTKPILVLVNEWDFSAGDFFPTIMQDNNRAKIFGTRTAGAGGFVRDYSYLSPLGIDSFRFTQSIAERIDGKPIESLGVTPDYPYSLTPDDLKSNYKGYVKAVNSTLTEMMTQE